jgi:hypothetical protein
MRTNNMKAILKAALRIVCILPFAAVVAFGQQQVNLTAGPATATLPDGSAVPMWGYSCGTAVAGSTATCLPLNPLVTVGSWSPVVITVPTGQSLTINLTNSLTFGANSVPTSLLIVGQLGGGLGILGQRTTTPSPDHTNAQPLTWPIAADPPGAPLSGVGTPPAQGPRVQSFGTEVGAGVTTALCWGLSCAVPTPALKPGTYLIESGTHPSIQGPMGLYGILVVTTAPVGTTAGTAYPAVGTTPAVSYNAEVPLLLSEIDPVQNNAVNTAVSTTGFSETMVWSGQPNGCGNPSSPTYHQCYPPAVNYTPFYYLINGVAFNRTLASTSLFPASPTTGVTGSVLVRFVNAGLRMHVPSIVGSVTTPAVVPTGTTAAAVSGFSLVAEDGNPLPGVSRVQSEVFLAAGKTYDVMVNAPAAGATALPVYDRELSLSANAIARDAGMVGYISVNGSGLPAAPAFTGAIARADTYNSVIAGQTFSVSDPGKGVIANDTNVFGVTVLAAPTGGTLTLNRNGTFTYTANAGTGSDSFTYCANGTVTGTTCSSGTSATVTLGGAPMEAASGIVLTNDSYTSNVATSLSIKSPGVLANDKDNAGYPLTINSFTAGAGITSLSVDRNGGFTATTSAPGTHTFTYTAKNSQGTVSSGSATVSITFPAPSNLAVTVLDGANKTSVISDYRWVIEEDRTFYVNPACTPNPTPTGCPTAASGIVPTFGTNFHTSYMPVVATGCTGPLSCESGQTIVDPTTGAHVAAVCDVGNGVCRADTTGQGFTAVLPGAVHLDPTKHYYLSVLPGDAANPFETTNLTNSCVNGGLSASCGHGMGGAPVACIPVAPAVTCTSTGTFPAITVLTQPTPFPPSKLSVFVFEDDFPLNGEQDGGGGIDTLSPNEPGLGQFNITLFDDAGGTGDATGQMTYDMFNQPLVNGLAGTPDPSNNNHDACPISAISRIGAGDPTQTGITGTIVTCPKYEDDGVTLSPLAGQAVIPNLMPGRYGVVATPGADRIAKGEEWLQTNTLDGQKAHDSFLRIGEPSFFQEFGPAGFHVSIGFANPKIINARLPGVCNGTDPNVTGTNCTNTVTGMVTTERMSRTPDERLYSSGSNDSFAFTQCYVSVGDPDGEDFAFTKCASDGSFSISGLPNGDWRVTVFDQWNDMLVDGLSTPVRLAGGATSNLGQIATNQWQANLYTKTFFDLNGNGIQDGNEPGLTLVSTNIRFRDGSYSNFNNTDLSGNAGFNEIFPLFSWYVVETDSTRYKNTGIHVVYDAGGPADGTLIPGSGSSTIGNFYANTAEPAAVALPTSPTNLRVPGAYYCANADCTDAASPFAPGGPGGTTGRVDPPWVLSEGWQGFSGQNSFIEFGKKPYAVGENGGIRGEVIYASTRPFDDPSLLIHTSWTPDVPGVTINLYQEGTAADGSTSLRLVDTTKTSSFDNWAQGFRSDGVPNMNCPGQYRDPASTPAGAASDLFFFTLFNQPMYLDFYNSQHGGPAPAALPNNSQFKCYDGMHNWNQVQPAPYDGMYQFPSVIALNPTTGKPVGVGGINGTPATIAGSNCTICIANPDTTDPYRVGTAMLPPGKYVVEMVNPPGYELVKEEDKNILIGDNYIAPVTQEFPGLGSAIYILPDQAAVGASYNANNAQNPTQDLGSLHLPRGEGDTGSVEQFWPCVGASRVVPDYISLFPQSHEVAPFAGSTRNLCDRKEVLVQNQASSLAKFWIFTSAHTAAHFTGVITDDFTSEFDPFSPQFGEKFSPANLPVAIKDWTGNEISRVYTDHWGTYNGLTYSTWEVNPPNPTGYAPTMMVTCMNDQGTGATPDPLFNPAYSQFCYEIPFMPAQTQYMDTPVTPTSAFAGAGYNNVDCSYPDLTPAIREVDGDGVGPYVNQAGHQLRITALGPQTVNNNAYSGPSATTAPFNQKTITRTYDFGTTAGTVSLVGSDGVSHPLTGVSWSPTLITGNVPSGLPSCGIQQQTQYGGSAASCGELVITRGDNGRSSIDTVTVTVGGKAPTHVLASGSIQRAIDLAMPGDLIMVDPTCTGTTGLIVGCNTTGATHTPSSHQELLLMWKPVRLQGVGAASSILNANTHPAGKLDVWRREVDCLFGLSLDGAPVSPTNLYDSTGAFSCPGTGWRNFVGTRNNPQVDRIPTEATVGWDATLNGNLAEMLQEPSLMGALEGAAITVLAKGVNFPSDPWVTAGGSFPTGTTLLTAANCTTATNPFPSNFSCNPSRIDGLTITNSSQGGGGIFVHAWGHNLQIANNRVINNTGTLTGGISVGQGEFPPSYLQGAVNADPGSCQNIAYVNTANAQLPYCHNVNVNVHHNNVSLNSSTGDELFSATPAGAGGVSFCTGADFYKFQYNWLCGNLSTGDGGGLGHIGFSYMGDIEHNTVLFNQSTNPTIASNGGGILIMGSPDADPTCGTTTDADCLPAPNSITPSDGVGPGLVVNANLIMGNAAESGSGGGLRLQQVNGGEVITFPNTPANWYKVAVTNNIVANNVAGWDGAGISLVDALNTDIINNTIISNDTTASSGVLFNTFGAPLASSTGSNCIQTGSTTSSCPQPSGLVSIQNGAVLAANLPATITCPAGHFAGTTASNGTCRSFSYPLVANDVFWQNRSFYIGVGNLGSGTLNQQHVVALYDAFTTTAAPSQPQADATTANGSGAIITGGTGACVSPVSYWDLGVRGDTGPTNHSSTVTLAPTYSVLTNATAYPGLNNTGSNPTFLSQYCNGSRIPPELGAAGYQVPPGISDATVPNPVFNLTPAATVDEGNNWININWGPLSRVSLTNVTLGNYAPAAGSSVINYIPSSATANYAEAPPLDFFGTLRKNGFVDAGAVEFTAGTTSAPPTLTSIAPTSGTRGTVVPVTLTGTNLTGATAVTVTGTGITVGALTATSTTVTTTFTITATAALGARTVSVTTPGGTSNTVTFTVVAPPQGTVSFTAATNGTLGTVLGVRTFTFTIPSPRAPVTSVVTVTNSGAAPLTITAENLLINIGGLYSVTATNCFTAPLAVGGTCTVTVTYATPATLPAFNDVGALAVRNNGSGTIPMPAPPYTPLALVAR